MLVFEGAGLAGFHRYAPGVTPSLKQLDRQTLPLCFQQLEEPRNRRQAQLRQEAQFIASYGAAVDQVCKIDLPSEAAVYGGFHTDCGY